MKENENVRPTLLDALIKSEASKSSGVSERFAKWHADQLVHISNAPKYDPSQVVKNMQLLSYTVGQMLLYGRDHPLAGKLTSEDFEILDKAKTICQQNINEHFTMRGGMYGKLYARVAGAR